jgi:hypothetical protein
MMNIDQSYVEKILKDLLNQPIYKVYDLEKNMPNTSPGLYFIYCELTENHKYLKFGKGENLSKRIKDHLRGKIRNSVYNRKLSKDIKIKASLTIDLKFDYNDESLSVKNRIHFTKKYCSFQYLNLNSDIISDCKKIYYDNNLYRQWCNKWNKNFNRNNDFIPTMDQKTEIVEYPIEQIINSEIRYYGNQPNILFDL